MLQQMIKTVAVCLWLLGALTQPTAAEVAAPPQILASIKPVGWLAQEIAPADFRIATLVPDGYSPHEYALRPQDALLLKQADLVLWIGPAMEPWLAQLAQRLPNGRQMALLPGGHHQHNRQADHALEHDPHLWLNPQAMTEAAQQLAAVLSAQYPQRADEIATNLTDFRQRMQVLDHELVADFAPLKSVGFAVYHDAYAHLTARYGLRQLVTVWRHESVPPGARTRAALLRQLAQGDVACLLYEPEHGREQVDKWLGQNTGLRYVEVDILGQAQPLARGAYEAFMRQLSQQLRECLQPPVETDL